MDNERKCVEIARYLGNPIDPNHPVSVELEAICNPEPPVPAGEKVYSFTPDDSNGVDKVYVATDDGSILSVKIELSAPTELDFVYRQTKQEYILLKEVLTSIDKNAFARRQVAQGRAMDKEEVKTVLDLILALNGDTGMPDQEVIRDTETDIYDLIVAMVRKVENYGNDYVLLAGTTANAEIEDFDKAYADEGKAIAVPIKQLLADKGIKLIKVFEYVTLRNAADNSGSDLPVLAADKMILVARNSKLLAGRPIAFCRRLTRDLIGNFGGTSDEKERATFITETPVQVPSSAIQVFGYGTFAFESYVAAVLNYRAVCWASV